MATAPGTIVNVTTSVTPNSPPSSIGTFFAVGQAASGPVGVPVAVTSLAQYVSVFGSRTANGATSTLYDAIDTFFQEGGQLAYVSRVFAAASISSDTASITLVDRAGSPLSTLKVSALGPGAYANTITVQVANGTVGNSYVLTIRNGSVTEISPNLLSPADAVNWAQAYSQTVVITNLNSATAAPNNNPAVAAATAMSGGTDNTSPASSDFVTALTYFNLSLGMGQVAAPGNTSATVWEGLITHAQSFNRWALLDGENTATAATITADAATVQSSVPDSSYGYMLAAWPIYPGIPSGTSTPPYPRVVAPSGPAAGAFARLSAAGNNGDVACAGVNGFLNNATGVTQTYVDSDRALLEAAGVCVIRQYNGNVQLYGATSLSVVQAWLDAGNARLRMQILGLARIIGDNYDFADIDAKGHTAAAYGGQLSAMMLQLYNAGALFGATPAEAFVVNTGASINTPTTAAARELVAQIAVSMSPTALNVIIDVTAFPVTQPIPS